MENKELREKIIDSLHWTEYAFMGQDNVGSLTQKSEEQIADQILALIRDYIREVGAK